MSLINDVIRHPLDPAYEAEAQKRRAADLPPSSGTRSPLLVLAVFLIGFGLAMSAMALRVPLGEAKKTHDQLVSRINDGQKLIDTRSGSVKSLDGEIARLQDSALARSNKPDVSNDLRDLETLTGAVAVTGAGGVLTVKDATTAATDAQGDPRSGSSDTGRVSSSDLQVVVNGLWQAGAEAISINGQRLTSLSAIRFAGQAILVNFRPLVPPYAISAIGPSTMYADFQKNSGGTYLAGLTKGFGISSAYDARKNLSIPAAPSVALNYARSAKENK
ncbi:DUF881 domain-containing protein [Yimella sp. cx-573]|nr:DUF881 domain-containing protein [Yimella sp. cx-573]